jgi:hypothetical protein
MQIGSQEAYFLLCEAPSKLKSYHVELAITSMVVQALREVVFPTLEMMTIYYSIVQFATTHHQVQLKIFLLPHFAYMSTKLLPRKASRFRIFQKNSLL